MTRHYGRPHRIVAIVAVMLGTFRCGSSPAESPGGAVVGATQSKSQAKKPNACLLLDHEDMERLAKGKVTRLHNIVAAEQTNCEIYLDGGAKSPVLILEVYWTGGRELARTEKLALGLAKRILNEKDVDIEALTGSGSVPGLADDAYYSDVMPSWVLKGDVLLKFTMPGLGADAMEKNFVPLARKALARLP